MPEKAVKRGFPGLPCLKCGEEDTVLVDLEDLTMCCSSCECEIAPAEVRSAVDQWLLVLAWLDSAPVRE